MSSKIITPKCCDDIKYFGTVFLSYGGSVYDSTTETAKPHWAVQQLDVNMFFALHPDIHLSERKWESEPKFCPYCATMLPKIQQRKKPYKNVCKITDGGYYCDTCEERLMGCTCYPPEFAWEIVE